MDSAFISAPDARSSGLGAVKIEAHLAKDTLESGRVALEPNAPARAPDASPVAASDHRDLYRALKQESELRPARSVLPLSPSSARQSADTADTSGAAGLCSTVTTPSEGTALASPTIWSGLTAQASWRSGDALTDVELAKLRKCEELFAMAPPRIRVGSAFQTVLPPCRPVPAEPPASQASDILLWRPNWAKLSSAALDEFLQAVQALCLCDTGEEAVLARLMANGYDAARTLSQFKAQAQREIEAGLLPDSTWRWTATERRAFAEALAVHGKNFERIAQLLGTRSRAECVAYYYRTPKSDCVLTLPDGEVPIDSDLDALLSGADSSSEGGELNTSLMVTSLARPQPAHVTHAAFLARPRSASLAQAHEPSDDSAAHASEFDALALTDGVAFYRSTETWTHATRTFLDSPVLEVLSRKRKLDERDADDAPAGAAGGPVVVQASATGADESPLHVPVQLFGDMEGILTPAVKRRRLLHEEEDADVPEATATTPKPLNASECVLQ